MQAGKKENRGKLGKTARGARRRAKLFARAALIAAPASCWLAGHHADAATNDTWTGGNSNNNYSTGSNWSGGTPGSSSIAYILSDSSQLTGASAKINYEPTKSNTTSFSVAAIEYVDATTPSNDNSLNFDNSNTNAITLTFGGSAITSGSTTVNDVILANLTTNATTLSFRPDAAAVTLALGDSTNNVVWVGSGDTVDVEVAVSGSSKNLTLLGGNSSATLKLGATDTYSGTTYVSGGTLLLAGSGSVNSSSGITISGSNAKFVQTSSTTVTPTITLTSGTLDGTSSVSAVSVANSASNIISAGNGSAGTLTMSSLNFSGAGSFQLASNQLVSVTGGVTFGGIVKLNSSPAVGWTNNSFYDLVNYGSVTGLGNVQVGTVTGLSSRQAAVLDTSHTDEIGIDIQGDSPVWTGSTNGNWDTTTTNWKLITAGTPTQYINTQGSADTVLFDDSLSGAQATTINISSGNVSPTGVTFSNTSTNYTLTGTNGISGTTSLIMTGSATVTINNTNSYTGGTLLSAGTIVANGDTALGNSGGTLTFEGGTLKAGAAIVSARNIVVNPGGGTFNTNGLSSSTTGTITLNTQFSVTGSGSLALNGTDVFGTAGSLSIGAGTSVALGQTTGPVAQSHGGVFNGNLVLPNAIEYDFNDPSGTGANPFTGTGQIQVVTSGALITNGSSTLGANVGVPILLNSTDPTGASFIKGSLTATSYTPSSFVTNIGGSTTGADAITISSGISGYSDVNFANSSTGGGKGELILSGTSSYSGITTFNSNVPAVAGQASVQIGIDNALPVNTDVVVGTNGIGQPVLDLNDHLLTIGSIADGPAATSSKELTITNLASSGTATLDVGGATNPATGFGGNITGAVNLVRSGTGTLNLTASNGYTGSTTVSGGTLMLSTGNAQINSTSVITINGSGAKFVQNSSVAIAPNITLTNGTLDGTKTISSTVTVGDGTGGVVSAGNGAAGTLSVNALTFNGAASFSLASGQVVSAGTLTTGAVNSSGIVSLNASAPSWTDGFYDFVNYTTLGGQGLADIAKGAVSGLTSRQSATLDSSHADEIGIDISGDSPAWSGADGSGGIGNWTTASTGPNHNWVLLSAGTPTDYISGDSVLFDDSHLAPGGATTVNISDANVTPASVIFNNSSNNYTLTSSNGYGITGATPLYKAGSGTLTIANNSNAYTGGTVISAGTVKVGIDNALPVAGNVALVNAAGALLDINGHNQTIGGLSGGGGSGGNVNLNGGNLNVSEGAAGTYSGVISDSVGTGNFIKSGSATLTIANTETYGSSWTSGGGGTTIVSAGTLALIDADTASAAIPNTALILASSGKFQLNGQNQTLQEISGTGQLSMNNDAMADTYQTLTVGDSNNTTFAGTLSGSGSLVKQGSGNLTLSATVSYTGTTTVNAGTLTLSPSTTTALALLAPSQGGSINGTLALGSPIVYDFNDNSTVAANPFSGSGSIQVLATGAVITNSGGTGNNPSTIQLPISLNPSGSEIPGALVISAGTLAYTTAGRFLTVIGGTTAATDAITIDGIISGSADVDFSNSTTGGGKGEVILAAANTYTGTTTFNANTGGIVQIAAGNTNALPVDTNVVIGTESSAGASTLDLNGNTLTIGSIANGPVSGGSLNITNTGTSAATLVIGGTTASPSAVTPVAGFSGSITDGTNFVTSLVKNGTGTLTLSGSSNTFSGGTTINGGTIRANGSTSSLGTNTIAVNSGATLGGSGTINNGSNAITIASGATITAGADAVTPGILTTGAQKWYGGGKYLAKITNATGAAGTAYDQLSIGSLTANSSVGTPFEIVLDSFTPGTPNTVGAVSNFTASSSYTWTIAQITGTPLNSSTSTPAILATTNTSGAPLTSTNFELDTSNFVAENPTSNKAFELVAVDTGGNDSLEVIYNATPEPGTALLVLGGAAPMLLGRRRRKACGAKN